MTEISKFSEFYSLFTSARTPHHVLESSKRDLWSNAMNRMTIEFYHDVVCGWCFVMSPRLRRLVQELPIEIKHRCFILQDNREQMIEVFGSMEMAKETILGHWEHCAAADDEPGRINIAGMRAQTFEYPNGLPGALACAAAGILGGDGLHWDVFDRIQSAHMTENRDIGDWRVLEDCAVEAGLDRQRFRAECAKPSTRLAVEADRRRARRLNIRSIPSLVIDDRVLPTTSTYSDLRKIVSQSLATTGYYRKAS